MTSLGGKLSGLLLALVGLFGFAMPAAARQPCAVIVDVSGSMAGFAAQEHDETFRSLLDALGSGCPEHHTLGDGLKPAPKDLNALRFTDEETRLGESLRRWLATSPSDRLLILTDNVADSRSGDDQKLFYDLIKSSKSRFTRVSVMLMRLPFNGKVFGAAGDPVATYREPRALALYVFQRRSGEGDFAAETRELLQAAPVRLAPLKGEEKDGRTGFYEISLLPFEPETERVAMNLSGAHRNVRIDQDGAVSVSRASGDQDVQVDMILTLEPNPRWDFGGLPLSATVRFPRDARFGEESAHACQVDPTVLPGGGKPTKIRVTCILPSPIAGMSEGQQAEVANSRAERTGALEVAVSARRRNLGLGETLARWSYDPRGAARLSSPTREVQARIYRLSDLLAGMSPQEEVHPVVARVPVRQKLYFFRPAVFRNLFLGLMSAALLGGLLFLASRPREIEVVGGGARVVKKVRLAGRINAELVGGLRATVWVTPAGFWIQAGESVSPPLLPPGGGRVAMGRERRMVDIKVRQTAAETQRRRPRPARRGR